MWIGSVLFLFIVSICVFKFLQMCFFAFRDLKTFQIQAFLFMVILSVFWYPAHQILAGIRAPTWEITCFKQQELFTFDALFPLRNLNVQWFVMLVSSLYLSGNLSFGASIWATIHMCSLSCLILNVNKTNTYKIKQYPRNIK